MTYSNDFINNLKRLSFGNQRDLIHIDRISISPDIHLARVFIDDKITTIKNSIFNSASKSEIKKLKLDLDAYEVLYSEWMDNFVYEDIETP